MSLIKSNFSDNEDFKVKSTTLKLISLNKTLTVNVSSPGKDFNISILNGYS